MLKKIFLLEQDEHADFNQFLLNLNMTRGKIFTQIIMVLECVMILLTYVKAELFKASDLMLYRYHYLLLFILAFVFNRISILQEKKILKAIRPLTLFIYLSVFISLLWSVSITRLDLANGGFITVYLAYLFMLSGVIVMKPVYSLLVLWAAHLALVLSTYSYNSFMEISVNGTMFLIFAWFMTRQQYHLIVQKFNRSELIEQKNTILEKQNYELIRLTMIDHLTGLYNRYSLDDVLSKKWLEAYVNQKMVLALMIDVDCFKHTNDTYGHMVGDKCLIEVSSILAKFVKTYEGYAFRYGGDEFCLIFYNPISISGLIENFKTAVSDMFIHADEERVSVSLTIGASSEIPTDMENIWRIIDNADKALYVEKAKINRRKHD